VRPTDSRRARNSASLRIGGRRLFASRPSLRRIFLASRRVDPREEVTSSRRRRRRPGPRSRRPPRPRGGGDAGASRPRRSGPPRPHRRPVPVELPRRHPCRCRGVRCRGVRGRDSRVRECRSRGRRWPRPCPRRPRRRPRVDVRGRLGAAASVGHPCRRHPCRRHPCPRCPCRRSRPRRPGHGRRAGPGAGRARPASRRPSSSAPRHRCRFPPGHRRVSGSAAGHRAAARRRRRTAAPGSDGVRERRPTGPRRHRWRQSARRRRRPGPLPSRARHDGGTGDQGSWWTPGPERDQAESRSRRADRCSSHPSRSLQRPTAPRRQPGRLGRGWGRGRRPSSTQRQPPPDDGRARRQRAVPRG